MAHERAISITTGELAALVGAELLGPPTIRLERIDALERAGAGTLSFIRSGAYLKDWENGKAAAALVSRDVPLGVLRETLGNGSAMREARALLVVPDADLAMVRVLDVFAARSAPVKPGVHATAAVDPGATVSPSAFIGPGCTVSAGAVIGENAALIAQVHVGHGAKVGAGTTIHPHVSVLDRCVVGAHCIIHPGVVIGGDGFGYRPSPDGRGLVKIPHIGNVDIGDHVEIGANTCIDRAKFGSTVIGSGTKIDNLVQIAHGCRIGRSCIICGKCGLAGSVVVGDGVVLGGGVSVADNLEIGSGSKLAALSGVVNNVPPGSIWMGAPAGPAGEWRRTYAALRRLGKKPSRD
ncbi:MAG TPA: UDP-3-O-(3-hydroxymyristoyl)glucosamine N-acyltransferase [Phycisphaerales bacterium]|nr:UDP-3-O-(3-hydroxymyristoyl)glucosamine N-acyltransferase [Phycisphaerales bacterium]